MDKEDISQNNENAENGDKNTDVIQKPQAEGQPENEPDRPDLAYKNAKDVARGGLLGLFIGLAIIVPGVSGSTVAIIFKLYDKIIYALGNLFKRFAACVKFLLPIVIGAFPAVKDEIKGEKPNALRVLLMILGVAIPIAIALGTTFGTEGERPLEGLEFYH